MNSIEMTAKTTEEAISRGLEQLGAGISDVKVEILEEGSKGLFGLFGSRPAKVRLTLIEEEASDEVKEIFAAAQAPRRAEKPAQEKPAPRAEKPARPPKAEKNPKPEAPAQPAEKPARKPRPEKKPEPAPAAEKPEAAQKPERPAAPVTPAVQLDRETKEGKAQDFLQQLTKLMGLDIQVHVHTDEEGYIRVDMQGDPSGVLIGRRGETLDSLQYLTSLYVNKGQSEYTRVTLDTENYRAKREDTLVRLANRMANRVVKSGRRVSLEPMNPYERRILHSALQGNDAVETHSEGEEPNRHVVITPKKRESAPAAED